jgi:hypothetical protein
VQAAPPQRQHRAPGARWSRFRRTQRAARQRPAIETCFQPAGLAQHAAQLLSPPLHHSLRLPLAVRRRQARPGRPIAPALPGRTLVQPRLPDGRTQTRRCQPSRACAASQQGSALRPRQTDAQHSWLQSSAAPPPPLSALSSLPAAAQRWRLRQRCLMPGAFQRIARRWPVTAAHLSPTPAASAAAAHPPGWRAGNWGDASRRRRARHRTKPQTAHVCHTFAPEQHAGARAAQRRLVRPHPLRLHARGAHCAGKSQGCWNREAATCRAREARGPTPLPCPLCEVAAATRPRAPTDRRAGTRHEPWHGRSSPPAQGLLQQAAPAMTCHQDSCQVRAAPLPLRARSLGPLPAQTCQQRMTTTSAARQARASTRKRRMAWHGAAADTRAANRQLRRRARSACCAHGLRRSPPQHGCRA